MIHRKFLPKEPAVDSAAQEPIHAPITWVYADAAERLAASGFEPYQLWCCCHQRSDESTWVLTQVSPPLWVRLGSDDAPHQLEVANFHDPRIGLPTPDPADIWIAVATGNGWNKDSVYTYEGSWQEDVPGEARGYVTSRGEIFYFKRNRQNTLEWISEHDKNLQRVDNVSLNNRSRVRHIKDHHHRRRPLTTRDQHTFSRESQRYHYPVCTIREFFKLTSGHYPGKRVQNWPEILLDPTLLGTARPRFYIGKANNINLSAGKSQSLRSVHSTGEVLQWDEASISYLMQCSTAPHTTLSGGLAPPYLALPNNGDRPRAISSVTNLGAGLYQVQIEKSNNIVSASWEPGTLVEFGSLPASSPSWQPFNCIGNGWSQHDSNKDRYSLKTPHAFYRTFNIPGLEDPGAFPGTASYLGEPYSERDILYCSVDIIRGHAPVLTEIKRLRDIIFYDTDGMDWPQYTVVDQLGVNYDLNTNPSQQWWKGIPQSSAMSGSGMTVTGVQTIRFTDPMNYSGEGGPGMDWVYRGLPLYGTIVSYTRGGSNYAKLVNYPIVLKAIAPIGYRPVLVKDPKPTTTNSFHLNHSGNPQSAGRVRMGYAGNFVQPCNPDYTPGSGPMSYNPRLQPAGKHHHHVMHYVLNYRNVLTNTKFYRHKERFRFLGVHKHGYITENSDAFVIHRLLNPWGNDEHVPMLKRQNCRS